MQHDHDRIARGRRRIALAIAATMLAACMTPALARADEAPPPAPPSGAAASPAPSDDPVVAQRGDVKLTASQVREMIRYAEPEQRHLLESNPQALMQQVRQRLLRLLLLREASAHQWDKRDDIAYRADQARQEVIASTWIASQVADAPGFPTEDQVKAAYEANKSKIVVPRQYHVAQIFIEVPPGASKQADDDAQHRLADLRQQIVKQHADFAVLAKRFSDDKGSAVNGGELGWVREDVMVAQIRTAVQAQAEGSVSEPVRSPNGWHLIKLIAVRQPSQATLSEAHDTLVKAMRQERLADGKNSYLADLLKQQPIEVNEIELSKFFAK